MYRVCFVCTGNICRSPMAESVFRARVTEAGLDALVEVDSAGDRRLVRGGRRRSAHRLRPRVRRVRADPPGPAVPGLVVRRSRPRHSARRRAPAGPAGARTHPEDAAKVRLLRSYDPAATAAETDVPDPYYGSLDGFELCLELVEAASAALLDAVREAVKEHTA